jgi:hypothetical protein
MKIGVNGEGGAELEFPLSIDNADPLAGCDRRIM